MRIQSILSLSVLAVGLCAVSIPATGVYAQDPATTSPDNSANNKRHTNTADKQSNAASDREAARKIRQSVIADKSLSTYAHNVKIIVQDGAVTLKGPVRSEDEKKRIANLATEVIGSADKVTNDISVKAGS